MKLRRIVFSAMGLGLLGLACATSPTGRMQIITESEATMAQMGIAAFEEIKAERTRSDNAAQRRLVQCVADSITNVLRPEDMNGVLVQSWQTELFEDESANAFALPGGRMGVHTGLLDVTESPAQLAAVMGHEVGHVLARHGAERVSSGKLSTFGMGVAQIWASGNPEGRADILQALGVGVQLGMLKYSRTHESEADEIGLMLMARAGFDPREAVALWQNMGRASGGAAPPEFLSTHPSGTTRIAELREAMPRAMEKYEEARAAGRRPSCR